MTIDRREFVRCLLALLASASMPAIGNAGPVERFVMKQYALAPGTEVWAVASRGELDFYNVRAVVVAVEHVKRDCYVWAIEYEIGHNVFWFTGSVAGHVETIARYIPKSIMDYAIERSSNNWRLQREWDHWCLDGKDSV